MENDPKIKLDHVLNSAQDGLEMAAQVLDLLERYERVILDFTASRRMTAFYANAFVMTLLERHDLEELKRRLDMRERRENVAAAMSRSAQRYLDGIRLSTQRPVPA